MADSTRMPGQQGYTPVQPSESRGGSSVGKTAGDIKSKAQEAASSLGQKAQEAASTVSERAQGLATQAGHKAQEAASAAAGKAEDALANVGGRMSTMAGALRERAPHEGMLGSAATAVADRLDAGGSYLREHDFRAMAEDFEAIVRRHPLPALLACFSVGCLFGMIWSKR